MPIFNLKKNKAVQLNPVSLRNEQELQDLIEANLEVIFGVQFIASQVRTDGGRIDTLGVDENKAPVIIEYKWGEQDEAIIQSLSYLDWVVRNRWEVEEIVRKKLGEKIKLEWGQPKVIVVAQSFGRRVKDAIAHLGENLELWTYAKYSGDVFVVEQFGSATPSVKTKRRVTEIKYETFTVQDHLKRGSKDTGRIFKELEVAILSLDDSIEERPKKFYIAYWHNRIFCKIRFRRHKLRVSLYTRGIVLNDPRKIAKPSPRGYEGSVEYRYFSLSKASDIPYAIDLIKQSYRATI